MDSADLLGAREIGDGTRDPKHTMKAAGRQPHRRGCVRQQPASQFVGRCHLTEQFAVGLCVGARAMAVVAVRLDLARRSDTTRDLGATLGGWRQGEVGSGDARDFNMEVDAVE